MTPTNDSIEATWERDIIPALHDYIEIPNLSPAFDRRWADNGHMEEAVELVIGWLRARPLEWAALEVARLDGRTPLIVGEIAATGGRTDIVLLYGHLDKQPEMRGWRPDLGAWKPVRQGDRLYGRGGADDGYSAFAVAAAVEEIRRSGRDHARLLVLIEASEESGSPDLPAHLDALGDRLGDVELVVCLDSGGPTYDRLWTTTSLRGVIGGRLRVDVLREGVHSGMAGGVVPSSFRVIRELLNRIEDPLTGTVLLPDCHADIPPNRVHEAERAGDLLGRSVFDEYPMVPGLQPQNPDPVEALLDRSWRPSVAVLGIDGLPPMAGASAVLSPYTEVSVSMRIPPTVDPGVALAELAGALTEDPPHGATVSFEAHTPAGGWNAPPTAPWLADALDDASREHFGLPSEATGIGGTIPFMAMLGERFPAAQFMIVGVLGPESNAHGPNEFLHIPYAKSLTACVADVLGAHADPATQITERQIWR